MRILARLLCTYFAVCSVSLSAGLAEAPQPSLRPWQKLMQSASTHLNHNEFPAAEADYRAAKKLSYDLGLVDANYMTLCGIASALMEQGKYAEAESIWREAASIHNDPGTWDMVASTLEKQFKWDDAIAIRRNHFMTEPEYKRWKAVEQHLSDEVFKHRDYKTSTSTYAILAAVLPPTADRCVGYVVDSGGDSYIDGIALSALDKAHFDTKVKEGLKWPGVQRLNFSSVPSLNALEVVKDSYRMQYYRMLRDRVAVEEKTLGANSLEALSTLVGSAGLLTEGAQQDAAESIYRHIITTCQSNNWNGSILMKACWNYGELLLKKKRYSEAEAQLRTAQELRQKLYSPDAYFVSSPAECLAKALTKLHRGDEAKALLSATKLDADKK